MPTDIPGLIYEHFSFNEGERPDFEKMMGYFIPQGLFINNKGEQPMVKSINDFVAFINGNIESGNIMSIHETEIKNSISLFGKVGQIASQYQLSTKTPNGLQTRYGVNLFQIIDTGSEWKVSSMCWDDGPGRDFLDFEL